MLTTRVWGYHLIHTLILKTDFYRTDFNQGIWFYFDYIMSLPSKVLHF